MAAALYNHMTGTQDADSAGTGVDHPGETLGERRERVGRTYVIEVMQQKEGIDISASESTPVTPDMLSKYDIVISMAQKEHTPDWLANHPTYHFWDVADPGGKDYDATITALAAVKRHVLAFVAEHGLQKPGA